MKRVGCEAETGAAALNAPNLPLKPACGRSSEEEEDDVLRAAAASDLPERFFQSGQIRADSTQRAAHETNGGLSNSKINLIRGNPSFAFRSEPEEEEEDPGVLVGEIQAEPERRASSRGGNLRVTLRSTDLGREGGTRSERTRSCSGDESRSVSGERAGPERTAGR